VDDPPESPPVYEQSMLNLLVYSRGAIEAILPHTEPHVIISITTTPDDQARLPISDMTRGTLRLSFPDLDTPDTQYGPDKIFNRSHAKQILSFVAEHHPNITTVIVHCDAGRSRSPGVAGALARIYNEDDTYFFKRYTPNTRVYSTLLEEHFVGDDASEI